MKKTEREYNFSDGKLQLHGSTVAETLPEDLEKFKAFDTTFSDDYPSLIESCLSEVQNIKTDMVVIDEMSEKTEAVNDAMADCNTAFRTIKFFVNKAFPDNKAVQNQFGFNDITKLRQNQTGMVVFMNDFNKVVTKYRDALIAEGCNVELIDSLTLLHVKLKDAKTAQELFKKERGLITQERIEKLNGLYELLSPVSEMAQIIFAEDEARLARYLMPRPKSSTNSVDDLIVS